MRRLSAPALIALLLLILGALFYIAYVFRSAWQKTVAEQVSSRLTMMKVIDAEFEARIKKKNQILDARPSAPITLLFVGDIMLARGVERVMQREQDPLWPFLRIADVIQRADFAFGNLESPLSTRGVNQGSEYSFRAEPGASYGLVFAGFDVLSLANNHIMDWGREALEDTVDTLRERGIVSVGAGENYEEANKPAILNVKGMKVAVVAFTTFYPKSLEAKENSAGVSSFDPQRAGEEIRNMKFSYVADLVVVSLHWGEEYAEAPSDEQRKIAHALVDAGADLVIGHHPHVVQEVEEYRPSTNSGLPRRAGWIAYSLGNFVFDQNFSEETGRGLMLTVKVQGGKVAEVAQKEVRFSVSFQPYIPPDTL